MAKKPVISIIGRPNVGKSTLFNRIIGKRVAVVDDQPGVTRDRNYYSTEWNGEQLLFVDTGGMLPTDNSAIPAAIHEQVTIAMQESAVVLFLVDATTGPVDTDIQIARIIRRSHPEKTLCVVNKCESKHRLYEENSYRELGLGPAYPISALHGSGVADVLDRATEIMKERLNSPICAPATADEALHLAIIGRPNAGKSSLVNTLLHRKRMIVDSVAGTTRDAIDSELHYKGKKVVLIDTAGLRKKSHVKHGMEYFANKRALGSIERCDICILMIDVEETIGVQDLRILRKVLELRKGVIIAWNKWDSIPKDHKTFDQLVADTRHLYRELQFIPMISLSALNGKRATTILDKAFQIRQRMSIRVPAAEFEDHIFTWVRTHPHPAIPANPVRFLGARQIDSTNPHFRLFVTNPREIRPSYHRYLLKKIYSTYDFEGCPVVIDYRPVRRHKKGHSPSPSIAHCDGFPEKS